VKRVAVKQLPAQQALRMGSVQIGAGAVRSNNNNNGAAQHRRGELQATAAITAPEEGTGEELAWRRMVDGGVEQASDIWAGVNSAVRGGGCTSWGFELIQSLTCSGLFSSSPPPPQPEKCDLLVSSKAAVNGTRTAYVAAAAAAKGTWEGIKPVRKVLWSDVLYSPKRAAFMRKW
jgi:hypothetical protein